MIYTMQMLREIYKNNKNIYQKISLEEKKGNIVRIKRGLYSSDINKDGEVISNICFSPSYISFEKALSIYGIIPEFVSAFTCACFNKVHNKAYINDKITLYYKNIPTSAFPLFVSTMKNEDGISYKIASKEKAVCDMLYIKYPIRSIKDLKILLYDDMRFDYNEIINLDLEKISILVPKYKSNTLNTFYKYLKGEKNANDRRIDSTIQS